MSIDQLLTALAQHDVKLFLEGNRLRYRSPAGAFTPELRAAIGEHREEVIRRLARGGTSPNNGVAKCVFCDWRNWVDDPPRGGSIRTKCRLCGRFIGYRPENL